MDENTDVRNKNIPKDRHRIPPLFDINNIYTIYAIEVENIINIK